MSNFLVLKYCVGNRSNSRCGDRGGIGLNVPTTYKQVPEIGMTEQQEQYDSDRAGYYNTRQQILDD